MKKILIVVDYQKDFVSGSLGFEDAKRLDDGIAKRMQEYLDRGDEVICTFDTHYDDYMDTYEGVRLPIPHCIYNTDGWGMYGKSGDVYFNNRDRIHSVVKNTFAAVSLIGVLDEITDFSDGKDIEVEICGVVTNMCVISNAVITKSVLKEANINIIENLCASNDKEMHDMAINILSGMQFNIITV